MFFKPSPAKLFVAAYTATAMYFSQKMVRLVLILGPASSIVAGIACAGLFEWSIKQLCIALEIDYDNMFGTNTAKLAAAAAADSDSQSTKKVETPGKKKGKELGAKIK